MKLLIFIATVILNLYSNEIYSIETSPHAYTTPVGSLAIDTKKLRPYTSKWIQKIPKDDQMIDAPGVYYETFLQNEEGHWQHIQTIDTGTEVQVTTTRLFEKDTLRLMEVRKVIENGPPQAPKSVEYQLGTNRYSMKAIMADDSIKESTNTMTMPQFDGQVGGLTIAALPLEKGLKLSLPMIIPSMKTEFWIEIFVKGEHVIRANNGDKITTWEVDTLWHNLMDGSVYPAGPHKSGGTYYINKKSKPGEPLVIAYSNENGLILWDGIKKS